MLLMKVDRWQRFLNGHHTLNQLLTDFIERQALGHDKEHAQAAAKMFARRFPASEGFRQLLLAWDIEGKADPIKRN